MRKMWEESSQLVCPHTAIGFEAASQSSFDRPLVVLATAHAAKFGGVVEAATGVLPKVPNALLGCLDKPKESTVIAARIRSFPLVSAPSLKASSQALSHSADGQLLIIRMKLSWRAPRRGIDIHDIQLTRTTVTQGVEFGIVDLHATG